MADAMPDHLRVAVLLAAWCQLRRGELLGLRLRDVDLLHGTVTVTLTRTVTMASAMLEKTPKTDAGRRTVAIPANVLPVLAEHLERFTPAGAGRAGSRRREGPPATVPGARDWLAPGPGEHRAT